MRPGWPELLKGRLVPWLHEGLTSEAVAETIRLRAIWREPSAP